MRFFAAVVTIACASAVAAGRQNPPAGDPVDPQFRTTTDLILVDVSVLDRARKPVRGIAAEEFTILEDGVPQEMASFVPIDLPEADVPPAKWMSRAPLDVQTNELGDGRMVLIYLDERQASASAAATKSTVDTAHAIIDQLAPKDVAAVAFLLDHRGAQEFTSDRGRLHAAVDTFSASAPVPVPVLGALRDVAQLLAGIPDRRKIVFYIGAGQAYDLEVLNVMDRMTSQASISVELFRAPGQQSQFDNLMSFFRVAQRANVTFYGIDPGLDGNSLNSAPREFLRLVSNATGGRAVIGTNAPAAQAAPIVAENASYYMLAFRSTNARSEGRFRRVEVKVSRPNVEVRSRRGYVEGRGGSSAAGSVTPALGRLIPATELSLSLWAAPAAGEPSGSHPVAMMIDVDVPREGARPNERLAVAYSIVDQGGREQASGREDLIVSPPIGDAPAYTISVPALASLPPGSYDIRVTAQLVERNRRGSLLGDVAVPDFARDTLSASGVFLGEVVKADPAGGAAGGHAIGRLLGVTPTTARLFPASAPIVAALRVYQKTPYSTVTIKTTIVDARDKVVLEGTERLAPTSFSAGFSDYRAPMPFAKLPAGQYLLRLELSRTGTPEVRREVRFGVR